MSEPATPQPEDPNMDIHKPKPWHNWREFLKEYAIIVLGVVTALAGEQLAEKLHDRARAAEARASIRAEIADDLAYMERRAATEDCVAARLDEVGGLIAAAAAGKLPQDALWIGSPFIFEMGSEKYKSAVQSGAFSLFDDKEQAAYAYLYEDFTAYNQAIEAEMHNWASLRTLETHPPASPTLDWEARNALQMARVNRWVVQATRLLAITHATSDGITPAPFAKLKMPDVCVPLHTPRQEALKLVRRPTWTLASP